MTFTANSRHRLLRDIHRTTDILLPLDTGDIAVLTLLGLSAAFDTVDHATLLRRLKTSYGMGSTVLGWFASYLSGRIQTIRCGMSASDASAVLCGVPQGSVLGPILFLLYTADLLQLVERHNLCPHMYADDMQITASVVQQQPHTPAASVCVY